MIHSCHCIPALRGRTVVLFDGDCRLCSETVRFLEARNRKGDLLFLAGKSETGRRLLENFHASDAVERSFVLIENGHCYLRSEAVLRVVRHLSGIWPFLSAMKVIPRFLRDRLYDWVARNRHRWFVRKTTCAIPEKDLSDKDS